MSAEGTNISQNNYKDPFDQFEIDLRRARYTDAPANEIVNLQIRELEGITDIALKRIKEIEENRPHLIHQCKIVAIDSVPNEQKRNLTLGQLRHLSLKELETVIHDLLPEKKQVSFNETLEKSVDFQTFNPQKKRSTNESITLKDMVRYTFVLLTIIYIAAKIIQDSNDKPS